MLNSSQRSFNHCKRYNSISNTTWLHTIVMMQRMTNKLYIYTQYGWRKSLDTSVTTDTKVHINMQTHLDGTFSNQFLILKISPKCLHVKSHISHMAHRKGGGEEGKEPPNKLAQQTLRQELQPNLTLSKLTTIPWPQWILHLPGYQAVVS